MVKNTQTNFETIPTTDKGPTILVGSLAKILVQAGIPTGQRKLFSWFRENGYLSKQKGFEYNSPTQKAIKLGLFSMKETIITHHDGHKTVKITPMITLKGRNYFIEKFTKAN